MVKIVIINFQATPFDIYADIVINDKISKILEEAGGKLQKWDGYGLHGEAIILRKVIT